VKFTLHYTGSHELLLSDLTLLVETWTDRTHVLHHNLALALESSASVEKGSLICHIYVVGVELLKVLSLLFELG
jgi:hypothetical protein